MTIKRYLNDPALSGFVTVTGIIETDRPAVRLAETWFHPQGGGQKADRGKIGPVSVIHVAHNAGDVDHFVDNVSALKVGETYPFEIDANWRRLNAAYHTAGHLIAAIVETRFPKLHALAGHQWPGEARVEFEGEFEDTQAIQSALEDGIKNDIAGETQVQIVGDPYTNRAIQIGSYTTIPCGGTHVSNLKDIKDVKIDGVKKKSGKLRVSYSVTN